MSIALYNAQLISIKRSDMIRDHTVLPATHTRTIPEPMMNITFKRSREVVSMRYMHRGFNFEGPFLTPFFPFPLDDDLLSSTYLEIFTLRSVRVVRARVFESEQLQNNMADCK